MWVGGPVPPGAGAVTLGALVIVRRGLEDSDHLMRHERGHMRQWRELGVVRFLVRYVGSYLRHRLSGRSHWGAYRRIPLEVEAAWDARRSAPTVGSTVGARAIG